MGGSLLGILAAGFVSHFVPRPSMFCLRWLSLLKFNCSEQGCGRKPSDWMRCCSRLTVSICFYEQKLHRRGFGWRETPWRWLVKADKPFGPMSLGIGRQSDARKSYFKGLEGSQTGLLAREGKLFFCLSGIDLAGNNTMRVKVQ